MDTIPQNILHKQCLECKKWLPATTEYFARQKHGRYGFRSKCKKCQRVSRQEGPKAESIPEGYKRCSACREIKPATIEYFSVAKRYRYGVNSRCKECVTANHGRRKSVRPCDNEGNIQCTKCKEWKPATSDFFYAMGNYGNFAGECKDCKRKSALQSYHEKPKKYKHLKPDATSKVCSKCKIEKPLDAFWKIQSRGSYYSRCIACERNFAPPDVEQKPLFVLTKVCQKCKQEKNTDEFYPRKEKSRDGLARLCKECEGKRHKQYYQENKDQLLDKGHKYHALKTSPKRESRIIHRDFHMMRMSEIQTRERARKMGVQHIEEVDYPRIFERDQNFCYICEGAILPEHRIAFDHVIPLTRGGSHTEDNIKLTHYVCNNRKLTRLVFEMTEFQRRGI